MKKLCVSLVCAIIITPQSTQTSQYQTAENLLCLLGKNAHNIIYKSLPQWETPAARTGKIIKCISSINRNLYKALEAQRTDPITTRALIETLALQHSTTENWLLCTLETPGAKRCIDLTKELYRDDLTAEKVEELYTCGAVLNYDACPRSYYNDKTNWHFKTYPISYWIQKHIHEYDKESSGKIPNIVAKFIKLGAKTTQDYYPYGQLLCSAIRENNFSIITLLLQYRPTTIHLDDLCAIWGPRNLKRAK